MGRSVDDFGTIDGFGRCFEEHRMLGGRLFIGKAAHAFFIDIEVNVGQRAGAGPKDQHCGNHRTPKKPGMPW